MLLIVFLSNNRVAVNAKNTIKQTLKNGKKVKRYDSPVP